LHTRSKAELSRYRHAGKDGERRHSSYSFLTSALDGVSGQSHAPVALNPRESTPGIHLTGCWVGPRAGLDTEASGKTLCRGSNPGRPACSQTLHWLSYPGSTCTPSAASRLPISVIQVSSDAVHRPTSEVGNEAWQEQL
jgi:hypothetical protein